MKHKDEGRIITFFITSDNHARIEAECRRYEAVEGCHCPPARVLNLLMAQHLPAVPPANVVEMDIKTGT